MRLADVLSEENIITDLKARDKTEVLGEMVDDISSIVDSVDRERVLKALLDREKLGTTGIGHGVAIPHGKIKGLAELKVFFGRSRKGVNFSSMDNLPVHLFFLAHPLLFATIFGALGTMRHDRDRAIRHLIVELKDGKYTLKRV